MALFYVLTGFLAFASLESKDFQARDLVFFLHNLQLVESSLSPKDICS